jgi:hypothetical protein
MPDTGERDWTRPAVEESQQAMPAPRRRHLYETATTDPKKLSAVELNRIIPIGEAAKLSSISPDGWYRHHKDKLIKLSEKRVGVRLRDALFITD